VALPYGPPKCSLWGYLVLRRPAKFTLGALLESLFGQFRARSCWPPGITAQVQAEAQSGSKATRPKTRRAIETRPVSRRVGLIARSMPYSPKCPERLSEKEFERRNRDLGGVQSTKSTKMGLLGTP
jgi:hypothetical protein